MSEEAEASIAPLFRTMAAHWVTIATVRIPPRPAPSARRRPAGSGATRSDVDPSVFDHESYAAELRWREVGCEVGSAECSPVSRIAVDAVIRGTASVALLKWLDL